VASTLIGIVVTEHEELNGGCLPLMADDTFVDDKQPLCSLVFPHESPHLKLVDVALRIAVTLSDVDYRFDLRRNLPFSSVKDGLREKCDLQNDLLELRVLKDTSMLGSVVCLEGRKSQL
jgi:hypothetical protein